VHRNQAGRGWISKAFVYVLSSTAAGLASGAVLGAAGAFLPVELRVATGSILAVAAIAVGGIELFGRHVQPLQFDCETPQRWVNRGPLGWATRNGLALGFGATSRIGFCLWYVVPLGSFLVGDAGLGAVVYGTYGLTRSLGAVFILLGILRYKTDASDWLIDRYGDARTLAAGQLVFLGVATAVVVGI
jgi:hypothetical protein